ncbi:hypothetical protein, partial [Paenibacillus borealis]|uniref:hypothetical protein n=1 Tax=Paenibacillus borealis TaxID=160799 RepID=UPI001C4DC26C
MFVGVQTLYRMSGLFSTFFWLINRSVYTATIHGRYKRFGEIVVVHTVKNSRLLLCGPILLFIAVLNATIAQ